MREEEEANVMPLSTFLAHHTPAYCGTWAKAVEYLTTHPTESLLVERLRREYRRDGAFRQPIWVDESGRVCNGMHRITALILEDAADVPVVHSDQALVAVATVTYTATPSVRQGDDDLLSDALRSFPLTDGTWAEAFGQGSCNGVYEAHYSLSNTECCALLQSRMAEQARLFGYDIAIQTITARTAMEFNAWLDEQLAAS